MKTAFYTLLFVLLPLVATTGQNEQIIPDSVLVPKIRTYNDVDLNKREQTSSQLSPVDAHDNDIDIKRRREFSKLLLLPVPRQYNSVPLNRKLLGNQIPTNNDYSIYNSISLDQNFDLETLSAASTYALLGFNRYTEGRLSYQLSEQLTLNGGVYTAKYDILNAHFYDFGFVGALQYQLIDNIYIKAFGAYSVNSNDKSRDLNENMIGMFPKTYFGSGLEYKINNIIGIEGGMIRQLNPATGKWNNTPYIRPVFHIWKKK